MSTLPPEPDTTPRLAIVVPVYGHAVLVGEALQSALDQQTDFAAQIVVVNDGCPQAETDQMLSTISEAYPDRITYLRKPNGGLSSARNFAINHVLSYMPSVEAIFMLDADNRLRPQAMARAMATLDQDPTADWVYPSIDMFGIKARCDYGGPYSRLIHSEMNICEAGSLVRRRVFESGVMFDETYTLGFEDWHFFLTAGDAGFRGVNLEEFGFFYRKRPESMLATADRNIGLLVGQLRQSHPDFYHPAAQAKLEQVEAPRFAIYLSDEDVVLLTTDPDIDNKMTLSEYERDYWRSQTTPMKHRVPPFLIVTSQCFLNELRLAGLLHWTFWQMEQAATTHGLGFIASKAPTIPGEIGHQPATAQDQQRATLWIICSERLKALTKTRGLVESIANLSASDAKAKGVKITLVSTAPAATQDLLRCVELLKGSGYRAAGLRRWSWRQPSILWRGKEYLILRKWFNRQVVFPRVDTGLRDIGILVKSASDLSVDILKSIVTQNKGEARLHVFVLEDSAALISDDMMAQIDSVSFLNIPNFDDPESQKLQYFGAFLPAPQAPSANDKAMGLLYWLDEVHNFNCPQASRLMGTLRRFGVTTSLYVTMDTRSDIRVTLAYEYAYHHLCVSDLATADHLGGLGIPASKIKMTDVGTSRNG